MPSITSTTDVSTLTTEDVTPYTAQLRTFLTEQGHDSRTIESTVVGILAQPGAWGYTLSSFRTWLVERTPEEAPESTGDRSALGEALAAMRRRERDAKADAHQARQDLVSARVALAEAQSRAALPFDDQHPGWRDFWLQAARNATRSGHCPEYDTHADLMGGITRDQFRAEGVSLYDRESVTYRVSLSFDVTTTVESGEDADWIDYDGTSLARMAYDYRYDVTDYSVEEIDREEAGD